MHGGEQWKPTSWDWCPVVSAPDVEKAASLTIMRCDLSAVLHTGNCDCMTDVALVVAGRCDSKGDVVKGKCAIRLS